MNDVASIESGPTLEQILAFERAATTLPAPKKNRLIRNQLGLSPTSYAQKLNRYIDQPEALAFAPQLVMSLRRLREQRRHLREARPMEAGHQRSLFDATPGAQPLEVPEDLDTFSSGEQLREIGMGMADVAAAEVWKQRVDHAIATLARRPGVGGNLMPFTAEDVRLAVGDPPEGTSPNAMGPRFATASRRRIIRQVGSRNARRSSLHAHPIAVWIGVEERGA